MEDEPVHTFEGPTSGQDIKEWVIAKRYQCDMFRAPTPQLNLTLAQTKSLAAHLGVDPETIEAGHRGSIMGFQFVTGD